MNKFVRNFILFPLFLLIFSFNVGAVGACACGSVREGQKIGLTVMNKDGKTFEINYDIIQKLLVNINGKWFWSKKSKTNHLIQKVNEWGQENNDKDYQDFVKDYLSPDNNYFKHFVFITEATKSNVSALPEFIGPDDTGKIQLKKTTNLPDIFGYFLVVKDQTLWELRLSVENVQIVAASNTGIDKLDLDEAVLKVKDLKFLKVETPAERIKDLPTDLIER